VLQTRALEAPAPLHDRRGRDGERPELVGEVDPRERAPPQVRVAGDQRRDGDDVGRPGIAEWNTTAASAANPKSDPTKSASSRWKAARVDPS